MGAQDRTVCENSVWKRLWNVIRRLQNECSCPRMFIAFSFGQQKSATTCETGGGHVSQLLISRYEYRVL
jgi:hypothetical protein